MREPKAHTRPERVVRALGWPLVLTTADKAKVPVHKPGSNLTRAERSWQNPRNHVELTDDVLDDARRGRRLVSLVMPPDVVCIDIDERPLLHKLEKAVGTALLDTTLVVRSGRGYHLYYQLPKDRSIITHKYKAKAQKGNMPKGHRHWREIDVRTNGYMIAPPSLHYLGVEHYTFLDNGHVKPAKMPKALVNYFRWLKTHVGTNGHPPAAASPAKADNGSNIRVAIREQAKVSAGEPKVTKLVLQQILDALPVSTYANDIDAYHRVAAAVHYASGGKRWGRKAFLEWSASDPAYNDDEHRANNERIWSGLKFDPDDKNPITHRSLVKELREHSTLAKGHPIYKAIGDTGTPAAAKVNERTAALFRPSADAVPLAPIPNDVYIDIPGYPQERVSAALNGTQAERDALVLAILDDLDIGDMQFSAKVQTCIDITERNAEQADRDIWAQRILKHTGIRVKTLDRMRRDARKKISEAEGNQVQDIVGRATQLYAERYDVIASLGVLYERADESGLYRAVNEHMLSASLVDTFRGALQVVDRENLPTIVRSAVDLLKLERNVDGLTGKWTKRLGRKKAHVVDNARLTWRHNHVFKVYSDVRLCRGDSMMNTRNAEVTVHWMKHLSSIRKMLRGKRGGQFAKPGMSTADLLRLPIDVKLSGIKGIDSVDKDRERAYHLSAARVDYRSNKKTLAAIDSGGLQRFIKYLDLVSTGMAPTQRIEFVTALLDMMAYCMQPVRHSSVFFMLYGRSGVGKSFASLVISALSPPGVVAKQSLSALADNEQFGMQDLEGKYMPYEDDAKGFTRETVAKLKELTHTNQVVEVAQKHTNKSDVVYTYLSRHVVTILTNVAPRMTDPSGAIQRRAQLLRFINRIDGDFDQFKHGVPLLTDEASAIFNVLRLRLPRILATPRWYQPEWMEREAVAMTKSDVLSQTIEDTLKYKPGARLPVDELTATFKLQNQAYGAARNSHLSFTMVMDRLREFGYTVEGTDVLDVELVTPSSKASEKGKKNKRQSKRRR